MLGHRRETLGSVGSETDELPFQLLVQLWVLASEEGISIENTHQAINRQLRTAQVTQMLTALCPRDEGGDSQGDRRPGSEEPGEEALGFP